MGERPVSAVPPRKGSPGWKLRAPHDKLAQGLVVSGFSSLPTGRALFLEFGWDGVLASGGGAWLKTLAAVAPVTDADGRDPRAVAFGVTFSGLQKMGLPAEALASFDRPFQEGMFQEDRLRRLGDRREAEWLKTVIPGGPRWSGNTPPADPELGEAQVPTPVTVHALLLLYAPDEPTAESWCEQVGAALEPHKVKIVHRLHLDLRLDERGIAREHFGFADGISQPVPYEDGAVVRGGAPIEPESEPWNGVPLGEVLMGHMNGHHEVALGPIVPDSPAGREAGLAPQPQAEGFLDLGLDGSYMVVRELKQKVAEFWQTLERAAEHMRAADPEHSGHVTADWLAERVVGRDRDGNLLCPGGVLPADADGQPDNDFGYFDRDQHGFGCPVGSHVRRGNPRDGLAPTAADKPTLLAASKNHRILRRGRKYGPTIARRDEKDDADRGLLFIALNTDVTRQFEFVQQTWMLNRNFATLYDEADPLLGPAGTMTIREQPLRRIIDVDSFVEMAGGEYFFLPSMPAINYLAAL
ncbi:hypothetical protein [Sphingomonas sp. dw_22]|uniref:Dyp-type peroxidase n=1 Tax=Sphingomonas sp. dw_22 TaxID=2721175 RepID=UPI001BD2103A|nr:hypothetical protein [Sphingomonas sp. dw_22]